MSIFDNQFYPTPESVIRKMLEPCINTLNKKQILEPSAGSGAILDFISHGNGCKMSNLYAIESNQELLMILSEKGYRILSEDFLNYHPEHRFDLIVMNPPFANGDEHVLHAWEIMKKGDIYALVNAETINNPYTQRRQLLARIIAQYGTVEMLGNCFSTADRRTDVSVALIRLHKDEEDELFKIDIEGGKKEEVPDFSAAVSGVQVAVSDQMEAYLRAWEKAKEYTAEYLRARSKMETFVSTFLPIDRAIKTIEKQFESHYCEDKTTAAYNAFINEAKAEAWKMIISKMGIEKYMTANLRNSFDKFCQSQSAYDLSAENVRKIIEFICLNIGNIMDRAVVDVYDMFCRFYKDNACHEEGWKTNNQFKVNRKVILPRFVSAGYNWEKYGCRKKYTTECGVWREYEDIDKVMCYLSGTSYESMDKFNKDSCSYERLTLKTAITFVDVGDSGLYESEFFLFRCYKKGTLHITFKDEALWARFNQVVNKGKNQIGYNL